MAYYLTSDEMFRWPREYSFDVLKHLRAMERRIPHKKVQCREELVKYMKLICNNCEFNTITLHLGVALFDAFSTSTQLLIPSNELYLISFLCVKVAAKFIGGSQYQLAKIQRQLGESGKRLVVLEKMILTASEWKLMAPTTATFVSFLMQYAIQPGDILFCDVSFTIEKMIRRKVNLKMEVYLERVLQDERASQLPPSMLGAACILAARIELKLKPTWTTNLVTITDYKEVELCPALHVVLGL